MKAFQLRSNKNSVTFNDNSYEIQSVENAMANSSTFPKNSMFAKSDSIMLSSDFISRSWCLIDSEELVTPHVKTKK